MLSNNFQYGLMKIRALVAPQFTYAQFSNNKKKVSQFRLSVVNPLGPDDFSRHVSADNIGLTIVKF